MTWKKIGESIKIFVWNIPDTLKKTSVWLIISYLIPILNIGIIWGIQGDKFSFNLNILSILLATNACFITSLVYLIDNEREITKILNTVTFVIAVVLFAFSIAQQELKTTIFNIEIYRFGSLLTLILSIIFGLISKYDEVEAKSRERASIAKTINNTTIGGKNIQL